MDLRRGRSVIGVFSVNPAARVVLVVEHDQLAAELASCSNRAMSPV